ncbi:sigma-E factor negative regulatory protein [Marinobacter caseinilyticus]|uniref:sigma-E factor negative regulatory protein n=1 Tax=Marinobacter caseinilyticus TaxID=2692195 RepID=UPI0014087209|nr:sigma-E factor negative regulatory protein [Marinobacter caseinilyticus]
MDDRLKETLSAMMDDQADELSVRRLLSKADSGDLRGQWQRWQQVRELMHEEPALTSQIDVSHQVQASLFGESPPLAAGADRLAQRRSVATWRWPAVAMITVSLVIGFGLGAGWDSKSATSIAATDSSRTGEEATLLVTDAGEVSDQIPEVALQKLDNKQWEHLSRYLLEHAQHNSVGAGRGAVGYARLASVSGTGR